MSQFVTKKDPQTYRKDLIARLVAWNEFAREVRLRKEALAVLSEDLFPEEKVPVQPSLLSTGRSEERLYPLGPFGIFSAEERQRLCRWGHQSPATHSWASQ
jgi:hypothetical protein